MRRAGAVGGALALALAGAARPDSNVDAAAVRVQTAPASAAATPATLPPPAATPPPPPAPFETPQPALLATPLQALPAAPLASASPSSSSSATPATARTPGPAASDQPSIPESLDDNALKATARRPIAALAQVRWMTGTWTARSSEQTSNGTSRLRAVTAYVFGFTMKGRWLFGADGKSRDFLYLTYDPFSERWIALRLEGSPSYGMWFSEIGWQNGRIEFTSGDSYANGLLYRRRMTIARKGPRRFDIATDEQLGDGTWVADDAVELTKTK